MTPLLVDLPSTHSSSRDGATVAVIVLHATAGRDSRSWLVSNPNGVSAHILIRRDGIVYRMVPDARAAHHCGRSRIVVSGRVYDAGSRPNPNQISLGLELENLNDGKQPYPPEQLSALGWQLAEWSRRYPNARMVFHRDVDTQGKTDPAGLAWPAVYAAMAPWLVPMALYTADSPIIAAPGMSRAALAEALANRCTASPYGSSAVYALGETYYDVSVAVGVDPVLAAAQMCHETANLTSPRSQPPQRNLAGIGATNDGAAGLSFASLDAAVRAQVGRLVAYALAPRDRNVAQAMLATVALDARPLPAKCQGSAPTLRALGSGPNEVDGCGWAHPGERYGAALAETANVLRRLG